MRGRTVIGTGTVTGTGTGTGTGIDIGTGIDTGRGEHMLFVERRMNDAMSICSPDQTGGRDADPPHVTENDQELAALAKALGHPVRILILRSLIHVGACYFGKLADLLPVAPSTASQHLAILKEAGLVKGDVDGPRPCYCVNTEALGRMRGLLSDL